MCENIRALNRWVDGWVGVMYEKTRKTRALLSGEKKLGHWVGRWKGGWMDEWYSWVKDCLQQSKKIIEPWLIKSTRYEGRHGQVVSASARRPGGPRFESRARQQIISINIFICQKLFVTPVEI